MITVINANNEFPIIINIIIIEKNNNQHNEIY